ncbi:MAG: aminoacyl-tRNA hydrolase, partial [Patescibacteria group bacterium]
ILPEKYMNNSGKSVGPVIKSKKAAENLIVIHDDLDLPIGRFKISFGSGSAGHKGVESIMRAVKTKDFIRIKVGISPATHSGKIKKPQGKKVIEHILGNFKPQELKIIKKVSKKISEAMASILTDGLDKTMSIYCSR